MSKEQAGAYVILLLLLLYLYGLGLRRIYEMSLDRTTTGFFGQRVSRCSFEQEQRR